MELLVVIGIIALLISILLPALSKARASANDVKCKSQLRQVVTAMMLHANDLSGFMPLVGAVVVKNGVFSTDSVALHDPLQKRYEYFKNGASYEALGMPGSIARYLNTDLDVTSQAAVRDGLNKGLFNKVMVCPGDVEGGAIGFEL